MRFDLSDEEWALLEPLQNPVQRARADGERFSTNHSSYQQKEP